MAADRSAFPPESAPSSGGEQNEVAANEVSTGLLNALNSAPQSAAQVLDGFFSLSGEMLAIIGFDGRMQRVNPAFHRILGYEPHEVLQRTVCDFVHPDERAALEAEARRLCEGGQAISFENRFLCKNGHYKWLLWNAGVNLEQRTIYATAHDITKRRAAQEATRRTDRFLTNIVENIPHMIFVKDAAELRFVKINKAEEAMMGLTQEEMIGKNDYDLFPESEAEFFVSNDRAVLESGQLLDIPEEPVHSANGVRIFHTKKIPIFDESGAPQYLLGISEDITERRQAEEALRARNALIQADLDLARAMQEAFIVKDYPCFPQGAHGKALCFAHRYIPAAMLGGDFFDVLAWSDTRAGVFICDVMGHGVRSALVTAMLRALVGEKNSVSTDPAEFLTVLNRQLYGILEQAGTMMFASAFYLVADTQRGVMSFANAGHPSPLLRREGRIERLLSNGTPTGPALGVLPDITYETVHRELKADDLLMLFTDGLFEVQGQSDEYGEERLRAALQKHAALPPTALFDAVLSEIRAFSATGEFDDDVCLLGMSATRLGL